MLDASLLDILVCPETHQSVRLADDVTIKQVHAALEAGRLKNRDGTTVGEPIQAGLVRADGQFLYPVREGIPIMLVGEAIPLSLVDLT